MAGRFLLTMAIGALAAAAATAAFTWLVDPLGIYASPRIEGFNAVKPALKTRSRIFKTVTVANGDWQALVVGTSRAETGLDPRHPYFHGLRCFNAALGGESYPESLALVRAAANRGGLRRVVAVLDFEVANAHYEGGADYVVDNFRPWRKAALALNLDVASQALGTPARQDAQSALDDHALWSSDGRFVFPPPPHGSRAAALASESKYLQEAYFRGPARQYALATATSRPMESVRDLVALAHASDIQLVLVIAPAHARQLETYAAAGLWNFWEQWKRSLVDINEAGAKAARKTPFHLWDFSGYNDATTERFPAPGDRAPMGWYYESSHFTPRLGNRILDRIGGAADDGFGIMLDRDNIEAHLTEARAARERWRKSNPDDAAEIAALWSQGASLRGRSRGP